MEAKQAIVNKRSALKKKRVIIFNFHVKWFMTSCFTTRYLLYSSGDKMVEIPVVPTEDEFPLVTMEKQLLSCETLGASYRPLYRSQWIRIYTATFP